MFAKRKFTGFIISLLLIVFVAFGFVSCKPTAKDSSTGTDVVVTLSQNELSMAHLESATLTATVEGSENTVEWTAEDDTKIRLVEDGNTVTLLATAEGETSVTATVDGASASCVITITRASEVPVLIGVESSVAVLAAETLTLTPSVSFKGSVVSEATFTYTSDKASVVSVSEQGTVKGEKVGTANVTIKANYYGYETEKTVAVTVIENATLSIVSEANEVYLANPDNDSAIKTSLQLTVNVSENGANVSNAEVLFSVDGENATVSAGGLVTPVKSGEVTVTASWTSSNGTLISDKIVLSVKKAEATREGTADVDRGGDATLDLSKYTGLPTGDFTVTDPEIGESFAASRTGDLLALDGTKLGVGERTLVLENDTVKYTVNVTILSKLITTKEELLNLVAYASNVKEVSWDTWGTPHSAISYDGYYKLGANIDLGSSVVTGDGGTQWDNAAAMDAGLHGVFDGQGYTISNGIYGAGGLLGMVSRNGVVKNVGFVQAVLGASSRGDTSKGEHCGIVAAAFHGKASNVFIDVIHEGGSWFGGPFGYCSYSATYENVIVYFPSTQGDSNAIARVIRGESSAKGLYVFANDTASNDGKTTNTAGIADAFGSGCTIYPYNTLLSETNIEGFDEEIWNLNGDKVIFLSQINEVTEKCEEADGASLFSGNSISFGTSVMGAPVVVTANEQLPTGVTLENNVLTVTTALEEDAQIMLTVSWNNGVYIREITVNAKKAEFYKVVQEYLYEKYTGLAAGVKVANTNDFVIDLTNAATEGGKPVVIPSDKTYEVKLTNSKGELLLKEYVLNGKTITLTAKTVAAIAGDEYELVLIADGGLYQLVVPVGIINKQIATADELLNFIAYADNVREVSWTLYGREEKGKAYDGYFRLVADIDLGASVVSNDDVWATMYYGGTNSAAGGSDDTLGFTAGLHGVFDGNGYTITGGVYGVGGLLGMVSTNGVVKNVAFVGAKMQKGGFAGVVAGAFNGLAQNVLVDVTNFDGDAPTSAPFGYSVMNATFENVVVYIPDDGANVSGSYMGAIGYVNRNTTCANVYVFTNTLYVFASGTWYETSSAASYGVSAYGLTTTLSATDIATKDFAANIWDLSGDKATFVTKKA